MGSDGGAAGALAGRSLLALRGMPADELRALLKRALDAAAPPPDATTLNDRTAGLLFFEDSTRTRSSFRLAAEQLGMRVIDVSGAHTSVTKGESLADTGRTVASMGADCLVVRSRAAGGPGVVARATGLPVINAGDGRHEHPTQGLLDALALAEAFDRTRDFDLNGLRVLIVGDVVNSRVARSASAALATLGAQVAFVGPPPLVPASLTALGGHVARSLDDELPHADAVMMLRMQFERHGGGAKVSARAFRDRFALTEARAAAMPSHAVVMHPGPINRGVEIDGSVADGSRSLITRQVALGVMVRRAVFEVALSRCDQTAPRVHGRQQQPAGAPS